MLPYYIQQYFLCKKDSYNAEEILEKRKILDKKGYSL